MKSLRAVLDVGVLVSALLRADGPAGRLLRLLLEERAFELVVSSEILEELERALSDKAVQRHRQDSPEALELIPAALGLVATLVNGAPVRELPVPTDPEDEKYLAAATRGGAEIVVSSDPHLLGLEGADIPQVISPQAFLDLVELSREQERAVELV